VRKEDLVARVLALRGDAPGLVHVLSAMEACPSYKPWPRRLDLGRISFSRSMRVIRRKMPQAAAVPP